MREPGNAATALRMRLRFPTPGCPFGPAEGFTDDAIRLATLGYIYLELADEMGNSAARQHLHGGVMRLGTVYRDFRYMRRWEEFGDAYEAYINQMRDFYTPGDNLCSVCAGFRLTG